MKCPHCNTGIHTNFAETIFFSYSKPGMFVGWKARYGSCSECHEAIIYLGVGEAIRQPNNAVTIVGNYKERMSEPRGVGRPCPKEVPETLANDFQEAVAVLSISHQASAALTRRSVQQVLRDHGGTTKKDLALQIDEIIATGSLPSALAEQLDAVRHIGNFAAHPLKSTNTGEIIPVEPHEAEWNLDVLEELFDHFFVKPAKSKARKNELNKKLADAGKPLLP